MTKRVFSSAFLAVFVISAGLMGIAQETKNAKPGLLTPPEIKRLAPTSYFFDGQSAPVETRNTVGFRSGGGKLAMAGLVDTSGYATDIQQKYQGFLIAETPLDVQGSELQPGQYGFGFTKDGKFVVMNVAATDVLSVSSESDQKLARPVPLKMVEEGGTYRLYAGRKYVTLKAK
jgi:hypothetical protein